MLKVILAFGSCNKGCPASSVEAPVPVELPLKLKDKVVPFPVEGFGKATALET